MITRAVPCAQQLHTLPRGWTNKAQVLALKLAAGSGAGAGPRTAPGGVWAWARRRVFPAHGPGQPRRWRPHRGGGSHAMKPLIIKPYCRPVVRVDEAGVSALLRWLHRDEQSMRCVRAWLNWGSLLRRLRFQTAAMAMDTPDSACDA